MNKFFPFVFLFESFCFGQSQGYRASFAELICCHQAGKTKRSVEIQYVIDTRRVDEVEKKLNVEPKRLNFQAKRLVVEPQRLKNQAKRMDDEAKWLSVEPERLDFQVKGSFKNINITAKK